MRILLVANTLPPRDISGVGEQVVQLASGLEALGHEVRVLGRGSGGARGPKVLFPLTVVPAVVKALRRWRPQVVQIHESDGALAALVTRLLRRWLQPRPFLVALQQVSYVREVAVVRPLRDRGREISRPSLVERRFRWLKGPLQVVLGRWTSRLADLVLAPSRVTAEELRQDYGVAEVEVLPNVTGGLEIQPQPMPTMEAEPEGFLLFVGRLRIRKGLEVLLEALAHPSLVAADPAAAAPRPRLLVAGDGEHRGEVEKAVARLGLGDSVRLLGRASPGQVRWLLRRARALVVPSTYEGMPLVILEAMEAGVPVVASAVSGIPEVVVAATADPGAREAVAESREADPGDGGVDEEATGWLVPPEDAQALAAALGAVVADDAAAARRRGAAGRRRLEARFRPHHSARRWNDLLIARLAAWEASP